MNIVPLIAGWIIGIVLAVFITWGITRHLDRRHKARWLAAQKRRQEVREAVLALRGEYDNRISDPILAITAEYADSVEDARQRLDEEVRFHDELEDLFGPGSSYRKNLQEKWRHLFSTESEAKEETY